MLKWMWCQFRMGRIEPYPPGEQHGPQKEREATNDIRGGAVLWCHIPHTAEQRTNWEAHSC